MAANTNRYCSISPFFLTETDRGGLFIRYFTIGKYFLFFIREIVYYVFASIDRYTRYTPEYSEIRLRALRMLRRRY